MITISCGSCGAPYKFKENEELPKFLNCSYCGSSIVEDINVNDNNKLTIVNINGDFNTINIKYGNKNNGETIEINGDHGDNFIYCEQVEFTINGDHNEIRINKKVKINKSKTTGDFNDLIKTK